MGSRPRLGFGRSVGTGLLAVATLGIAVASSAAAENSVRARVRRQLIVAERAGASPAAVDGTFRRLGAVPAARLARLAATVLEVSQTERPRIERALRQSGLFKSIERDHLAQITEVSNDPHFAVQWGLTQVGAPLAWTVSTGSPSVVVALLDTGAERSHPDLAGQLLAGYDFISNDEDASDDHGHGTRMAGIIAARRNNGEGIAGLAPDTRLLPVKVLDAQGFGPYSGIARGITYAVDRGARILSLSLAGTAPSTVLQSAVDYATANGAVVVAAAGNLGNSSPAYPAACAGAAAVSATDSSDRRAAFSNFGAWISVAAPGASILTTALGGGYAPSSGTSPAAAFGSGTLALLLAAQPGLTPRAAIARMEVGSRDLGSTGWDPYYGWGRIDAYGTLVPPTATSPPAADKARPVVSILSPAKGSLVFGTVPVEVVASDNVAVDRVSLYINNRLHATETRPPYSFLVDTAVVPGSRYKLIARAYDTSGNLAVSRAVTVKVTPGVGLLVRRAAVKPDAVSLTARFILPDGTGVDPASDEISLTLRSAAGTVLSVAAPLRAAALDSRRRVELAGLPAQPGAGTVSIAISPPDANGISTLRLSAKGLEPGTGTDAIMGLTVRLGGAVLSQSLAFRRRGAATLVYP